MVTTTADSGPGSLRQAILNSNSLTGATNTVEFDIGGYGVRTITLLSPLPAVTGPLLIDGTTQPGYAGTPLIGLDAGPSSSPDGLTIDGVDLSVSGLANPGFAFGTVSEPGALTVLSGHRQSGRVDSYRIDTSADSLLVAQVHADGLFDPPAPL